jgi:hypothetical protein
MTEERPLAYADEDVDARVIGALRKRGFDVVTAREAGLLGRGDDEHMDHAAIAGRVLLTCNRRHFRRLHAQLQRAGQLHPGVALLPKSSNVERMVVRAAMLLDWWATLEAGRTQLVNWNDLQVRLHRGERLPGYDEEQVRVALGLHPHEADRAE